MFVSIDEAKLTTPAAIAAISDRVCLSSAAECILGQSSRILNSAAENVVPSRYPHLYQKCSGRICIADTSAIAAVKKTTPVIIILVDRYRVLL